MCVADRKQKISIQRTEEVGFHTDEIFMLQRMDSQESAGTAPAGLTNTTSEGGSLSGAATGAAAQAGAGGAGGPRPTSQMASVAAALMADPLVLLERPKLMYEKFKY